MDTPELEPAKSKSAIKREFKAIQDFVKTLIDIPDSHLKRLPLSDAIQNEIVQARGMSKSALKRQIGFISKQMRDEPFEEAKKLLANFQQPAAAANAQFHQLERWRDRLLEGDDELIQQLVVEQDANRQKLRQLIRSAAEEKQRDAAPKSSRALFQYLRSLTETPD